MGMELMNELPKGWIECQLDEIFSIKKEKGIPNNTPYLEIGDININTKNYLLKDKPSVKGCKKVSKNDVVISRVRPTRGAISLIKENELDVSSAFTVVSNEHKLNQRLLFYFLAWNDSFLNTLGENCTGTMYPTVSEGFISAYKILVPPRNEQDLIVAKLDKLLSKVETAKARLDTIPQTLKRFRQSVLSAAVSGELTKEWKVENKISEEWMSVYLKEISEKIQIGPFGTQLHKSDYISNGIPLINPTHIQNYLIVPDLSFTINKKKFLELKNYHLLHGDIIMGRRGEMGRCALVSEKENNWICGTGSFFIRPNKKIDSKFLFLVLRSDDIKKFLEGESKGTTMSNLNLTILKNVPISFPILEEQKEIVRRVEQLFKLADQIEARYDKAKQYTEKLTQSILSKAFRGELVPQDPNDEPAEILLKRIKAKNIYNK